MSALLIGETVTWSNWHLEILVCVERGQQPTANSIEIWRQLRKSNPRQIGGRRVLSPLSDQLIILFIYKIFADSTPRSTIIMSKSGREA